MEGEARMSYFVTGGTGFLGRFLIGNLLKRNGTIHVLVRKDSLKKFDALAKKMGWDPKRVLPVTGVKLSRQLGCTVHGGRTLSRAAQAFIGLLKADAG